MFTAELNYPKVAAYATRLAKLIRDHFQIEGEPPPPSGGATTPIVVDVTLTIMSLQWEMPHHAGDRVTISPDWAKSDAIERIWIAAAKIRALFGEDRAGAAINPPSSIPADLVKALEYGARVLAEYQESVTPATGEKPIEAGGAESVPGGNGDSVETRAIGMLAMHKEWSKIQIAEAIGTNPKYLSDKRHTRFLAAWAVLHHQIPRGSKSADRGIEAIGDEDLDFDAMDAGNGR